MRLRAAIVGCGRMGVLTTERTRSLLPEAWFPLSHADAMSANNKYEIVAVCDVDEQKAISTAAQLGLPPKAAYTDFDAMLLAEHPDVLSIATRTPGRVDLIERAVTAGVRGIHCEKPLSQHFHDGVEVLSRVESAGVHFSYGTLRRFMPAYRMAKALIDQGAIGEVREVVVDLAWHDMLLWSHPHSIDLLIYFTSETQIASVNAVCEFGDTEVSRGLIDCDPKVDFARVRFASGKLGLITSSSGMNLRVSGSEGIVEVRANGASVEVFRKGAGATFDDREVIAVPSAPSGTYQAFDELADAVQSGAKLGISTAEIAANQRIIWAVATSALLDGKTVRAAEVDEDLVITGRTGALTA